MPEPLYIIVYRGGFIRESEWHGLPRTWRGLLRWLQWLRTTDSTSYARVVRVERADA